MLEVATNSEGDPQTDDANQAKHNSLNLHRRPQSRIEGWRKTLAHVNRKVNKEIVILRIQFDLNPVREKPERSQRREEVNFVPLSMVSITFSSWLPFGHADRRILTYRNSILFRFLRLIRT